MALRTWIGWEKIHQWFKQGKTKIVSSQEYEHKSQPQKIEKWLIDKRFQCFVNRTETVNMVDQTQLRKENFKKKKIKGVGEAPSMISKL